MRKKEVKQYKRGDSGFVYRIHLNKTDKLEGGQEVYIFTEEELKKHDNNIQIQEDSKEYEKLLEKYEVTIDNNNLTVSEFTKQINDLTNRLNSAIDDKNTYKDTIAGLKILLGKYQNRNLLNRILNKPLTITNDDDNLIVSKNKKIIE